MNLAAAILVACLSLAPPPQIGNLALPQEYWVYTLEAAQETGVDPCIIWGVLAIESRGDPEAESEQGRCVGLMQLDPEAGRGIDRRNPRQSILRGAEILARLLRKHHGNLRLAIRAYNGTGNRAYEREVLRAVAQARRRWGSSQWPVVSSQ